MKNGIILWHFGCDVHAGLPLMEQTSDQTHGRFLKIAKPAHGPMQGTSILKFIPISSASFMHFYIQPLLPLARPD
jgi:hypothetical protein